ncbi:MAG: type VI secretion system baseplate subunit TssG [bacterium]|nr:type VI secretion system baseplate subunit TssG [bacterium]
MAKTSWNMSRTLTDRLVEEPFAFAFYQAIFLLESLHREHDRIGEFGHPGKEIVRLTNVDSLSFSPNQISSIEFSESDDGDIQFKLATSIMGLYGVFSPLPMNYTASLISWSDDNKEARQRQRDFLDIFNHRLLSLLYRSEKYTRITQTDKDHGSAGTRALGALVGFWEKSGNQAGTGSSGDLSLARLLMASTRSAAGLKNWIKRIFTGVGVRIEQFCPRWILVPEESQASLGKNNSCLAGEGSDYEQVATLGEMMYDRETKFRIHLGPLNWNNFVRFLPGRDDYNKLVGEVDNFLGDSLTYDVMLKLLGQECYHLRTCLDGKSSQLGFTAGLFREDAADSDLCLSIDVAMTGDGTE